MKNNDLYPIGSYIEIVKKGSYSGTQYNPGEVYQIKKPDSELTPHIVEAINPNGRIVRVSMNASIRNYGVEAKLVGSSDQIQNIYEIY